MDFNHEEEIEGSELEEEEYDPDMIDLGYASSDSFERAYLKSLEPVRLGREWIGCSSRGVDLNVSVWYEDGGFGSYAPLEDESLWPDLPKLPQEVVETMIIARISPFEIRKKCTVNKRIWTIVSSGMFARERKRLGIKEKWIFISPGPGHDFFALNNNFSVCRYLPALPENYFFNLNDKETLCVGTQLLVVGREYNGVGLGDAAIYIYDVVMNKWSRGNPMNDARTLYASASNGDYAYVAGGYNDKVQAFINTAEKYDPNTRTWERIPSMTVCRRSSAGVYMDGKFYVIGGTDIGRKRYTCAEVYDEEANSWEMIPGMLTGLANSLTPPLCAVVDNELYMLETDSNNLMVYFKNTNTWKDLGPAPVRTASSKGWGVAFKSLGDELIVMGESRTDRSITSMTAFSCRPSPNAESVEWKPHDGRNRGRDPFVMNCAVMIV